MTAATVEDSSARSGGGGWLILLGVLALVLGVVGLFMTFALTVVGTLWLGALLVVAGVAHIIFGIREKSGRWINLLLGVVYLLAGLVIAFNPLSAALSLTLLIGIMLSVLGVARVVWSFFFPGVTAKVWGILGGLLSVALGWMIIAGWPLTGLWVPGLFIAVDLLVYGATMIGVGWRRR